MNLKTHILFFILITSSVSGRAEVDINQIQDDAVRRVQEYIQIDTVNPPGNESRAVDYFAKILEQEGIPFSSAESATGRGNIWATLKGGNKPPLILLHHMDVVPADEEYWDNPPYSGIIKDSHVIGRGTLDTKSLGIIHLQSLIALKRAGKKLNRDIIFMGTADEEAGGLYGAGWVIKEYPQLFKNGGVLLNEGGAGKINNQGVIFNIEVSQKIPFWLKLTATDIPGHGSVPRVTSAVTRLNRALYQIQTHQFPARIVPSVDKYFKGSSVLQNDDWQDAYMDMENAILEPDFLLKLQLKSNSDHALTRNMCAITRLQGSDKINVIPPTASAEIDCRLLPDQDIDAFLAEINRIINDTNIKVEVILSFTAAESSTNTDLYKSIVAGIEKNHPDSTIIAGVSTGFTDSHFFRDIGIDSYGFAPFIIPEKDRMGAHGNNERISVENIKNGVTLMIDIIEKMVY